MSLRAPAPAAALLVLLLVPLPLATAQGEAGGEDVLDVEVLSWMREGRPVWDQFAFLALAAILGTLTVIYPLVGGTLPGTVGAADLQLEKVELETHEAQFAEMARVYTKKRAGNPEAALPPMDGALGTYIIQKRRAYDRAQAMQFAISSVIFIVAGVGGALFFAQDVLQAALVGAGGPALVGQIVAKKEAAKKIARKNRVINRRREDDTPDDPRDRYAGFY